MNILAIVMIALACAAITYGTWLFSHPAGFVVGGVLVGCAGALLLPVRDSRSGRPRQ